VSDTFNGAIVVYLLQQIHKGETNTPQVIFEPRFAHKEQKPGPSVSLDEAVWQGRSSAGHRLISFGIG
jgi:hypothetical protein